MVTMKTRRWWCHWVTWEFGDELNEWNCLLGQKRGCVCLAHSWRKPASPPFPIHPHLFSLVQNDEARTLASHNFPSAMQMICIVFVNAVSLFTGLLIWTILTISATLTVATWPQPPFLRTYLHNCMLDTWLQKILLFVLWHRFRNSLVLDFLLLWHYGYKALT